MAPVIPATSATPAMPPHQDHDPEGGELDEGNGHQVREVFPGVRPAPGAA